MNANRLQIGLYVLFMIFSSGTYIGCSKNSDQGNLTRIRIGYLNHTSSLPVFVASERGMFTAAGIRVELIKFGSSRQQMDGLLTGNLDGTGGVGLPIIASVESKSPGNLKAYLIGVETGEDYSNYLLVRKDVEFDNIQSLKGKTIGTYTGSAPLMYLRLFLRRMGLNPDTDVKIRQVEVNLQVGALQQKQFDALYTIEPEATIAMQQGIARSMIDNPRARYIMDPFPATANVLSASFVSQHPDLAEKLMAACEEAAHYAHEHRREALNILAKFTGMDTTIAQKSRLFQWWDRERVDATQVQKMIDLLHEYKELDRPVSMDGVIISATAAQNPEGNQ